MINKKFELIAILTLYLFFILFSVLWFSGFLHPEKRAYLDLNSIGEADIEGFVIVPIIVITLTIFVFLYLKNNFKTTRKVITEFSDNFRAIRL